MSSKSQGKSNSKGKFGGKNIKGPDSSTKIKNIVREKLLDLHALQAYEVMSIHGVFLFIIKNKCDLGALTGYKRLQIFSFDHPIMHAALKLDRWIIPLANNLTEIHAWDGDKFIIHCPTTCLHKDPYFIICRLPEGLDKNTLSMLWNLLDSHACVTGDRSFDTYSYQKPKEACIRAEHLNFFDFDDHQLEHSKVFKGTRCEETYDKIKKIYNESKKFKVSVNNLSSYFWSNVFNKSLIEIDEDVDKLMIEEKPRLFVKENDARKTVESLKKMPLICCRKNFGMHRIYFSRPIDQELISVSKEHKSLEMTIGAVNALSTMYSHLVEQKMYKIRNGINYFRSPYEKHNLCSDYGLDDISLNMEYLPNKADLYDYFEEKNCHITDILKTVARAFDQTMASSGFTLINYEGHNDYEICHWDCKECGLVSYELVSEFEPTVKLFTRFVALGKCLKNFD